MICNRQHVRPNGIQPFVVTIPDGLLTRARAAGQPASIPALLADWRQSGQPMLPCQNPQCPGFQVPAQGEYGLQVGEVAIIAVARRPVPARPDPQNPALHLKELCSLADPNNSVHQVHITIVAYLLFISLNLE